MDAVVKDLALRLYGQICLVHTGDFRYACLCEAHDLVDELLDALSVKEVERYAARHAAVQEEREVERQVAEITATR